MRTNFRQFVPAATGFCLLWIGVTFSSAHILAVPLFTGVLTQTGSRIVHSTGAFYIDAPGDTEKAEAMKPKEWDSAEDMMAKQEIHLDAIYDGYATDDSPLSFPSNSYPGKLCYFLSGYLRFGIVVIEGTQSRVGTPKATTYVFNALALCAYHPKFSPDGRYIAFILGWPGNFLINTRLYVLDTQTETLSKASGTHEHITSFEWSPDSRALAFVWDASYTQQRDQPAVNLALVMYHLQSRKETIIIQTRTQFGLGDGYSWSGSHCLVFTRSIAPKAGLVNVVGERYGLFAWDAGSGKIHLVLPDASDPLCSPDGKRIAFFGPKDRKLAAQAKRDKTNHEAANLNAQNRFYSGLCVANLDGTGRKELEWDTGAWLPMLRWHPDSRHLVVSQSDVSEDANGAGTLRTPLRVWDAITGYHRTVGDFETKQHQAAYPYFRPSDKPAFPYVQISPLALSNKDGRVQLIASVSSSYAHEEMCIQALDLQNGALTTLASGTGKYYYLDSWAAP